MMPSRLGLSPDLFVTAFPFHVAFDRDMRIVQAGVVLRRLCPKLSPGSPLHQLFEISRPHIQFTFEAIREQSQSLFILESLDTRLRLKGQMLPDSRRGVMFFLCSPWLTELAAAEALELSLSDFAIHDPVADFLFLLQSKDSALSDLNRLAMKLREQHAELQSTSTSLSRAHEETVLLLAAAAEAHDQTTGLHLKSVRSITEALASELGFSDGGAKDLGLAAVLHDIGKVRVPNSILTSPGALASEEWDLMKDHTIGGYEFLAGHEGYELAAAIARSHHERWDGTGYPDALSGEDLPEGAAIVAVADAFDAITSDRPYKDRRPIDEAVQEIRAFSGKQFSPRVVAALSRLYEKGKLAGEKWLATTEQAA